MPRSELPFPNPQQLRRIIRQQRSSLSAHEQRVHSHCASLRLARSTLFLNSRRIAVYLSENGELDPAPLMQRARAMGKRCFLPVLRPRPQRSLWFCEYRPGDPLVTNRYGIDEPFIRQRPPVSPWGLDLIVVPLVAFDPHGHRLGMGGGFYDRTLNYLRLRRHWRSPRLVGIAHECQKVEKLNTNPWDIPLNAVVTESAFYSWD